MYLNKIRPAASSRPEKQRVGRGIGSTLGKTCGKGHKGQKARAGGFHKLGFEGGQMPLQRRLPKIGFTCLKKRFSAEVRLGELPLTLNEITLESLKISDVIPKHSKSAKIIDSGELSRPVTVIGVGVTQGARAKIEAAGGKIEV